MTDGLSTADLGRPDLKLALAQHAAYVAALEQCGLAVTSLPPDNNYPDSTFVEDPAVLLPDAAVITRPGAPSRRGETAAIEQALTVHFDLLHHIESPGTLDGGDIMAVGGHYFIGLSERTNAAGAAQLIDIVQEHGLTGATISLAAGLHLKSSVAYLENRTLVATGSLIQHRDFAGYNLIEIPGDEAYAANCLWINGTVLVAAGFPRTVEALQKAGFAVIPLDVSEFRKLDGGLSCLSLRF
jgi:dimethylargininase